MLCNRWGCALAFARAGLLANRDDHDLRALSVELAAAAAAAGPGLTVRLRDEAKRAEILHTHEKLPQDLAALSRCFYEVRDKGQYAMMLSFAEHGIRLAKRLSTVSNSQDSLMFQRHRAEAYNFLGQYKKALLETEKLGSVYPDVFGPEHNETLYVRYLMAYCRRDLGQYQQALDEAAVLATDQAAALGEDHPYILSTRYLMADCRRHLGQYQQALDEAMVLATDQAAALGEDHPDTLATQQFVSERQAELEGRSPDPQSGAENGEDSIV